MSGDLDGWTAKASKRLKAEQNELGRESTATPGRKTFIDLIQHVKIGTLLGVALLGVDGLEMLASRLGWSSDVFEMGPKSAPIDDLKW